MMKQIFAEILQRLDTVQGHAPDDIVDAKETVQEIQEKMLEEGEQVEEAWLTKRFRNIARMGPDILDVVTAALVNPAAGVAMTVKKIAEKARADSGWSPFRETTWYDSLCLCNMMHSTDLYGMNHMILWAGCSKLPILTDSR